MCMRSRVGTYRWGTLRPNDASEKCPGTPRSGTHRHGIRQDSKERKSFSTGDIDFLEEKTLAGKNILVIYAYLLVDTVQCTVHTRTFCKGSWELYLVSSRSSELKTSRLSRPGLLSPGGGEGVSLGFFAGCIFLISSRGLNNYADTKAKQLFNSLIPNIF
jgi:hypothetical protein